MKVFRTDELAERIDKAGYSKSEFVTAMIRTLPETSTLKPSKTALLNVLGGAMPGACYIALYATVLNCSVDDLFGEDES